MSTIVTIQSTDVISSSRTDLNTNFSNLNADKIETSYLDTDTALTANSDSKIATQKAVKAYVDSGGNPNASLTTRGLSEEATAAEIDASTQTGGTGAELFVNPKYLNDCHNVPTVAPSTSGNFMRSNGTDWISESVGIPFTSQIISLLKSTTVQTNMQVTSNLTGTVLYVALYTSGTITLYRLAKDSNSSSFYKTHTTTLGLGGGNSLNGLAMVGSYLYVIRTTTGTGGVTRYDAADLANVTTMTISGTNDFGQQGSSFSDGTFLYHWSTTATFRKYSISGTTLTDSTTTIGYTSSGTALSAICDATSVWLVDSTSGTVVMRKYPLAGGAATSTTTVILTTDGFPNGIGIGMFIWNSSIIGICHAYTLDSNSAVVSTAMYTLGLTSA